MPHECMGRKADDPGLPEPCRIWFSSDKPSGNPSMPHECIGRKAGDPNLPEPCRNWFSMENQQDMPGNQQGSQEWQSQDSETLECISPEQAEPSSQEVAVAHLPALNFPRPFEPGYFTGLQSEDVIGTFENIDIIADKNVLTFQYPADPFVARTVLLKNKGSKEVMVEYRAKITIPNFDETMFINHPQPPRLYLGPSESQPIRLVYSPQTGGPSAPKWELGEVIETPMELELFVFSEGGGMVPKTRQVVLQNTVKVIGKPGSQFKEPEGNAEIGGTVVDSEQNPLPGIPVVISTGRAGIEVQTDDSGSFSAPVFAFMRGGTKVWSEFVVSINPGSHELRHKGYAGLNRILIPREGETASIQVTLPRRTRKADYALVKTLDIGLQAYAWDASRDGSIIAAVPFHTNFGTEVLAREANLHAFTSGGDLLWKYPLGGETPTVDVSDDATLIATTKVKQAGAGGHWGGIPILLDSRGNFVREFPVQPTRFWWGEVDEPFSEVQLSRDNKYLAAGDTFGRLFLFDAETGEQLWEGFTRGQVRRLWFDDSLDRLYASSGDGYLRAFDLEGNLVWKTFVDAWLTDMDVSNKYIAATSKGGRSMLHLIGKSDGRTIWVYPLEQRGSGVAISPDESFVFYGTDIGRGSTPMISAVFSIAGQPLFDMGDTGQAGAITNDSQYIVSKDGKMLSLYSRDGQLLWRKTITEKGDIGSMNHLLWISPDAKRIVVGLNDRPEGRFYGQIYFLEGGVQTASLC